jgi:hypothetical protein
MAEFGIEPSCVDVAKQYAGLCDCFVIDEVDRGVAGEIESLGMRVEVCNTVMVTEQDKIDLGCRMIEIATE